MTHSTIQFAEDQLRRYLGRITNDTPSISVGLIREVAGASAPKVADPVVDDAIDIEVRGGSGHIAGINPRSVLIGVYRYLTELGCRWVRPGADGEYVPKLDSLPDVRVWETPSYRHRGICIEGAVSEEHVRDMIDWMPKLGFNGYFIQFREAHTFFDRWYSHEDNPNLQGKHITIDEAREFTARTVAEIKKRDLLYHAVGHGWTCEPFGISGMGWVKSEQEVPEETARYLAEVNGKRELWGGIALNTNLCYGNPEVRRIVIEEIADYSAKHPEIDIMHFWLADGVNNHCECELCRDALPSDLYVRMLNELDALLTERGLKTRIVFLIYVDLLWPPQTEKIANPDRFILMFAPITRTYSKSFAVGDTLPELPPYTRNKLEFPSSVDLNVAFLRAWKKDFGGDSFDFDYHLMWDHLRDPGYTPIAKVLSEDIKGLADIGLDGFVSCQLQRAFFPTGLPMTVMGATLWNSDAEYDDIASDYFAAAYGPDGALVRKYLETISDLFDPTYFRGEKPKVNPESAGKLSRISGVVAEFGPTIERNQHISNECWAKSWFYLKHHASICLLLSTAAQAVARDDKEAAAGAWAATKDYVLTNEMQLHPALDCQFFVSTLGWFFG